MTQHYYSEKQFSKLRIKEIEVKLRGNTLNFKTGYEVIPLGEYNGFQEIQLNWEYSRNILHPHDDTFNGTTIFLTSPSAFGKFLIHSYANADNADLVEKTTLVVVKGNSVEIINTCQLNNLK